MAKSMQSRMRMGARRYVSHYNRQSLMHYREYDSITVKANWSGDLEILMATEADYRLVREYLFYTETRRDIIDRFHWPRLQRQWKREAEYFRSKNRWLLPPMKKY